VIHLFNKIYLKSDKLLKISRTRIVISEEFGGYNIIPTTAMHELSNSAPIPAVFSHKNYETFVREQFGFNEKEFFDFLMKWDPNERLTIYCDAEALLIIVTKFWKTIYPTWNEDFYVKMLNYALSYFVEVLSVGRTYGGNITQENADDVFNSYKVFFEDQNQEALKQRWRQTNPWFLTKEERQFIHERVGMELQLANVLLSPGWRHADVFKRKLVKAVKKEFLFEFLSNMRTVILKSLVNFKWLEPDTKFDLRIHTLHDLVEMHPKYRFLSDPLFSPDNVDYVYSNYDMSVIREINQKLWNHPFGFEIDWSPLIKQDLTYEDIIAFEMSRPLNRLLLRYGDYYETVNSYLLDDLLDAARDDKMHLFRQLQLR